MGKNIRIPFSSNGFDMSVGKFSEIVDDPRFQRLREVKQLDMIYKVFPGATHTRFEHSLGTMYRESNILDSVERNGFFEFDNVQKNSGELAALVHDIGHPPFSHAAEFILIYFGQPDHDQHTVDVVRCMDDEIGRIDDVDHEIVMAILEKKDPIHKTIKSMVGADTIDYVIRDAKSCGMDVNSDTNRIEAYAVFDGNEYGVESKARETVRSHAQSYIHMYTDVYNRKSLPMLKGQLRRGIYELVKSGSIKPEEIWNLTDCELLCKMVNSKGVSRDMYNKIRDRKIPKSFLTLKIEGMRSQEETRKKPLFIYELPESDISKIANAFENLDNVIAFEDSACEELGLGKGEAILGDMPHIKKLYPRDASLYNIDEGWTTLFNEMPQTKAQFIEDVKRKYAIRVGVSEPQRAFAYEKTKDIISLLDSYM